MPASAETTLRQQLMECTRVMVMAELLDYSGHVSARIPDTERVLIPGRDASRAGITVDDVVVVDLNGKILEGNQPAPTETAIHTGVYRARPDVQVVGHGHPPTDVHPIHYGRSTDDCHPQLRLSLHRHSGSSTRRISAPQNREMLSRVRSVNAAAASCAGTAVWLRLKASPKCFSIA